MGFTPSVSEELFNSLGLLLNCKQAKHLCAIDFKQKQEGFVTDEKRNLAHDNHIYFLLQDS